MDSFAIGTSHGLVQVFDHFVTDTWQEPSSPPREARFGILPSQPVFHRIYDGPDPNATADQGEWHHAVLAQRPDLPMFTSAIQHGNHRVYDPPSIRKVTESGRPSLDPDDDRGLLLHDQDVLVALNELAELVTFTASYAVISYRPKSYAPLVV